MSPPTFEFILSKVRPKIEKIDTDLREAIDAGARLEATLLYLITGDTYSRLQYMTRIHQSTLGKIIPEVCQAIYETLGKDYLGSSQLP